MGGCCTRMELRTVYVDPRDRRHRFKSKTQIEAEYGNVKHFLRTGGSYKIVRVHKGFDDTLILDDKGRYRRVRVPK